MDLHCNKRQSRLIWAIIKIKKYAAVPWTGNEYGKTENRITGQISRVTNGPLSKSKCYVRNALREVGHKPGKLICAGNVNILDLKTFIPFILLLGFFVLRESSPPLS